MNKSGLSLRVIDDIHPESFFSTGELNNLQENDTWVCCDKCEKWRMLPPDAETENLPESWYCQMNPNKEDASCDKPERDIKWYLEYYAEKERKVIADALMRKNQWMRCVLCRKQRMILNGVVYPPNQYWSCNMNSQDAEHSSCAAPERDFAWYLNHFSSKTRIKSSVDGFVNDAANIDRFDINDDKKNSFVKRDAILDRLVATEKVQSQKQIGQKKGVSFISRFLFHDMLLLDNDNNNKGT